MRARGFTNLAGDGMAVGPGSWDHAPAVRIRDVREPFGAMRALKPVSLNVTPGTVTPETVTALVGKNAAGHSVAFNCRAGRIAPSGGTVDILGGERAGGGPRASRRAGLVASYQEPHRRSRSRVTSTPTPNREHL